MDITVKVQYTHHLILIFNRSTTNLYNIDKASNMLVCHIQKCSYLQIVIDNNICFVSCCSLKPLKIILCNIDKTCNRLVCNIQ